MSAEAGESALPLVGPILPGSVDLLNYENICDNEYLSRILSSDGGKERGEAGSSSDKGASQTGSNSAGSGNTTFSSTTDTSVEKLEIYVRHLFHSSSGKYGEDQNGTRGRTGIKKIGVHGGDAHWVTSGNTPEEIVLYGDELRLGKQAINDRFSSEIYSLAKTQDAFSSLIYRQVVVVEHIVKSIAARCLKPRALPQLKYRGNEETSKKMKEKVEVSVVEDAVVCALRILEQQSRKGVQDIGAVEPLISLVLRVLRVSTSFTQENVTGRLAKNDSKGVKVSSIGLSEGGLLTGQATMSRGHFDFMRAILCNAYSNLAAYSPTVVGSKYSHVERAEKIKLCLCSAYGLLSIGACSNDVGDILVALADLAALCTLLEEWREQVVVLMHAEDEEVLTASGDGGSRKMQGNSVAGGSADRPLSGQKKELIEKSMSKQKPVHNPTTDVLSPAIAVPQPLPVKERHAGGNSKSLKIDTSSASLGDPDAPAADTPSNASLFEKDERASPTTFGEQKERFFPVPTKGGAMGPKEAPVPLTKEGKPARGAAKVVLDKDSKMRVRRVVDGQTHVPGRGPPGSMAVLSLSASAEHDAYARSLQEVQTKSLLKTLRSLGRVPQSVLQIVREASLSINIRSAAFRAKEKEKGKPVWDEKASASAAFAEGTPATAADASPAKGGVEGTAEPKHYVWAAGQNSYGELGLGDTSQRRKFTELPSQLYLNNQIVSLGAGNEHSVFVTKRGKLFVVGYNENGQCGLGNTQQARGPHALYALENEDVAQVHVYNGCEHTLAITTEGKLYSFGYNYRGQLGLGTTTSEVSPQLVRSLSTRRVVSAASSYHHSLILCDDGSLFSVWACLDR